MTQDYTMATMTATLNASTMRVTINGKMYQARHITHTTGHPAMLLSTEDRKFLAIIDPDNYKQDAKAEEVRALTAAIAQGGIAVEVE